MISVYYTSCMKNIMAYKLAKVSIKAISNLKKYVLAISLLYLIQYVNPIL